VFIVGAGAGRDCFVAVFGAVPPAVFALVFAVVFS
jgi:hypothetical protein